MSDQAASGLLGYKVYVRGQGGITTVHVLAVGQKA